MKVGGEIPGTGEERYRSSSLSTTEIRETSFGYKSGIRTEGVKEVSTTHPGGEPVISEIYTYSTT